MKQLTDEVFAQVREALAMNRVMGRDADGNYTRECTPKKITAALAALDTAQPVQVNAMLVEAGVLVDEIDADLGYIFGRIKNDDRCQTTIAANVRDKLKDIRAALTAAQQAQPERAPLYSLDTDSQDIRARTVHAVLGALALGANNENKPPSGHWLTEIWDIARAEREGAVDRVTTLFENCETPYLPDIARAIDGAAHGIKQGGHHA